MKTRNDFVSNSSSCSFVIAINKDYALKDFIADIVKDTISTAEPNYDTPDFIERLKEENARNLNYHLNCSELVYLGDCEVGETTDVYKNKEDEDGWNPYDDILDAINDPLFGTYDNEKVVSKTDDEIVISRTVHLRDVVAPSDDVRYKFGRIECYRDGQRNTDAEIVKNNAKSIVSYAKLADKYYDVAYSSDIYQITKNTINNTRDLLDAGYKIKFDKWENLDKLEERLNNGERIFRIRLANGGDGMSSTTIYGLGGWDAQIGKYATFETLDSECC